MKIYLLIFFYFSIVFQLLYLILDWCLKSSLLDFFFSLCSCSASGIFTSFKKTIPSNFADGLSDPLISEPAQPLCFLLLIPSIHYLLWVPLGLFTFFPRYLSISLSFQVTFLIFWSALLPRSQAFLGLHSHYSPVSSGIIPGTLTFSPIPNLPQILKVAVVMLVVSFRWYCTNGTNEKWNKMLWYFHLCTLQNWYTMRISINFSRETWFSIFSDCLLNVNHKQLLLSIW